MYTINCDDSSGEQQEEKRLSLGFFEKNQKSDLKVTAEGKNRTKFGSKRTGHHGDIPRAEGCNNMVARCRKVMCWNIEKNRLKMHYRIKKKIAIFLL